MKYKIQPIGSAFTDKGIAALSHRLTMESLEGWELHSVFSVEKKGCLGSSEGTTYLAIFRKEDARQEEA